MYNDYPDFHDYDYEEYREQTGHVTDFGADETYSYVIAVERYKKINPESLLRVGEGYHKGQGGLYCTAPVGDLGPFWRLFERT